MSQPGLSTATTYGYDAYGRLTSLSNPYSETTTWHFDGLTGDLDKQTFSTGAYSSYGYDVRGRVNAIGHYNSTGTSLWAESYVYDGANNLTTKYVPGDTVNYTYDNIDQLLSESSFIYGYLGYTYDGNGNRLTRTTGSTTENYAYDDGDKLTTIAVGGSNTRTYTYDTGGRPTSIWTTSGTRTLAYDDEDRLTSISGTGGGSYTYNGAGTRKTKTVSGITRNYVRSGAGVTAPVLADGAATYTPGISEKRGSTTSLALTDRMGSATNLANTSSTITDSKTFDAFGNVRASTGTNPTPFGYAADFGYQADESGLQLLGHRYYDPSARRFLTRDPAKSGMNWFRYCGNEPARFTDPSGLMPAHADANPRFQQQWARDQMPEGGLASVSLQDAGDALEDAIEAFGDFFGNGLMSIGSCSGYPAQLSDGQVHFVPGMQFIRILLGCDNQVRYGSGGYFVGGLLAGLAMGPMCGEIFAAAPTASITLEESGGSEATYGDKLGEAQAKYPGKAGKIEGHHNDPIYLGGAKSGPVSRIDAAYHQCITNAFRARWAYGTGVMPSAEELEAIKAAVYKLWPLP